MDIIGTVAAEGQQTPCAKKALCRREILPCRFGGGHPTAPTWLARKPLVYTGGLETQEPAPVDARTSEGAAGQVMCAEVIIRGVERRFSQAAVLAGVSKHNARIRSQYDAMAATDFM